MSGQRHATHTVEKIGGTSIADTQAADAIRYLCSHLFLDLKTSRERFNYARQFADADNLAVRQVANVRLANNRRHMMLTV
jgi:hypothetical protein